VVGLGLSAIFVRWADAPGAVTGFYRTGIAALVMALPFGLAVRRQPLRAGRPVWMAVLAGLCFAADLGLWNTSVLMTTAANATFLANTAPLWVGLGALVLFRERLRFAFWLGLLTALAGAGILLGGDFLAGAAAGLGGLLALAAGFFYAGFFLATQRAREGLGAFTSWWLSALASALGLLLACLLLGQPLTGYTTAAYLNFLALALVTQVGSYLFVNYALGHLPASIVSPTLLLQPIATLLLAIPLLGERPDLGRALGGLLVVAGVWIVNRHSR